MKRFLGFSFIFLAFLLAACRPAGQRADLPTQPSPGTQSIAYGGQVWLIKQVTLAAACSPGLPGLAAKSGDQCLMVLIDLAPNSPAKAASEPATTPTPLVLLLQVEDDQGNTSAAFNAMNTWDKDGKWLGQMVYFSVNPNAHEFFLVAPGIAKIPLDYQNTN